MLCSNFAVFLCQKGLPAFLGNGGKKHPEAQHQTWRREGCGIVNVLGTRPQHPELRLRPSPTLGDPRCQDCVETSALDDRGFDLWEQDTENCTVHNLSNSVLSIPCSFCSHSKTSFLVSVSTLTLYQPSSALPSKRNNQNVDLVSLQLRNVVVSC